MSDEKGIWASGEEVLAAISASLFGFLIEPYGRTEHTIRVGAHSPIPSTRGLPAGHEEGLPADTHPNGLPAGWQLRRCLRPAERH